MMMFIRGRAGEGCEDGRLCRVGGSIRPPHHIKTLEQDPLETPMPITLYSASVPVFVRLLGNLSKWIDKAEAHAQAKKFDPAVY
ncbi:MAG TPA: DUF1993 family protein, partial [Roseateles sp.]